MPIPLTITHICQYDQMDITKRMQLFLSWGECGDVKIVKIGEVERAD